jgi:hypothetical protein
LVAVVVGVGVAVAVVVGVVVGVGVAVAVAVVVGVAVAVGVGVGVAVAVVVGVAVVVVVTPMKLSEALDIRSDAPPSEVLQAAVHMLEVVSALRGRTNDNRLKLATVKRICEHTASEIGLMLATWDL